MARLAADRAGTSSFGASGREADGLARLMTFVSPYTGIVRGVREHLRAPDDARMTLASCRMASSEPTTGSPVDVVAAGSGYERDQAIAAAVGEALERYAGTCLPPDADVVFATAAELGPQAVAPERWALYNEAQYAEDGFPFEPFTSQTRVRWVKGWSIPDRSQVYLPLQLAYVVRRDMFVPGEARIGYTSTSGMALALDPDEAVLRGLLELVERDAVMLTWAHRLAHPRLDWRSDDALVARERRHFAPTGVTYHVLDLSVFLEVPTALAIVLGPGKLPEARSGVGLWGIGAASAPTMPQAWDKALRECFQTRLSLRADLLAHPERCDLGPMQVEEFTDHLYFYARVENQAKLDFLVGSPEVRDIRDVPALEGGDPAARVESVAQRLARRGVAAYAVDITPPDLAEAGLHVVHVLSPELQPIDFSHPRRFLGGRRLYDAPRDLGLRDRSPTPDQLNPDPHPFP